jgi:hypothetical protein
MIHNEQAERLAMAGQLSYERARLKGAITRLVGAAVGKSATLDSWAEAKHKHGIKCFGSRHGRLQSVPVAAIVGSVDRHTEFDHNFNPLLLSSRHRWRRIYQAMMSDVALPPVQLYKLGNRYYVRDGHHRVSVAKFCGIEYIDAEVIEYVITEGHEPGH